MIALLCAGCSTDNTSGQDGETAKPPPQIRVEAMPTATATLVPPTEVVTVTPEPTVAQVYIAPEPPDEDAIANDIDAIIADMNRNLKSQDLLIKP